MPRNLHHTFVSLHECILCILVSSLLYTVIGFNSEYIRSNEHWLHPPILSTEKGPGPSSEPGLARWAIQVELRAPGQDALIAAEDRAGDLGQVRTREKSVHHLESPRAMHRGHHVFLRTQKPGLVLSDPCKTNLATSKYKITYKITYKSVSSNHSSNPWSILMVRLEIKWLTSDKPEKIT